MKGIILAGGLGSRLLPITRSISKQLLPVYDKPMIYYPLATLMQAGIREILVISTPASLPLFAELLGDGSDLGLELAYLPQDRPRGIAEALIIGREHLAGGPSALILGDNVFHGTGLPEHLSQARDRLDGCVLFGRRVPDPQRYGIAEVDAAGVLRSLEEKPASPASDLAVTGLYLYDEHAPEMAAELAASERGELEITDLNAAYLEEKRASIVTLAQGIAWADTGTPESLLATSEYVRHLELQECIRVACLEEVALRMGFIGPEACYNLGLKMRNSSYGQYVMNVSEAWDNS
ncbi:glucose-1-phosphate thymidylyltransferase RfbA [Nocardiopsis flavescens]|uniref:Glucose-1-phosphate thymidylyltransferase n=1 Tax=Nocardiopsis flavescens TaxID=758803 RepID=A0A1M6LQ96_9ACTN|nr:glucose-1-phosphate thymidylyltransferase RfbA [Nocardiopsis flavescens]SHJ73340.1 glucose-1-phosphate thymidylyltransferase [Nocardiopsis flavescens]